MKIILTIILIHFVFLFGYSQSNIISDSLLNEVCKTFKSNAEVNDTLRISTAVATHLSEIFKKLNDSEINQASDYIFIRLQKLCREFKNMLDRSNPTQNVYIEVEAKPFTKLNEESCREFLQFQNYFYIEDNGDTVNLTIENNFWIDHFKDGTYSKLNFYWIDSCEFEIEFIESNNWIKKNLSNPGDKYKYQILEKHDNYFDMSLEIVGVNRFFTFKIYYKFPLLQE